ncbi:hypothetical protein [uncultured Halomonas sp.]|uniref:hypothetical protein n=1 Tax=uncultured Halomonas sp. TaxID=173971 RepID=UPI002639C652|nr:hypothetical protein [uncultured Halomonas sp.]
MNTSVIKIKRGRYSASFQVVRAWLSAASALVTDDPEQASAFIRSAIKDLSRLHEELREEQ